MTCCHLFFRSPAGGPDPHAGQSRKKNRATHSVTVFFVNPKGQAGALVDEAVFADRRVGSLSSFRHRADRLGWDRPDSLGLLVGCRSSENIPRCTAVRSLRGIGLATEV